MPNHLNLDTKPFPYFVQGGRIYFSAISKYLLELTHNLVLKKEPCETYRVMGKINAQQRERFERAAAYQRMVLGGEQIYLLDDMDVQWVNSKKLPISSSMSTTPFAYLKMPSTQEIAAEKPPLTSPVVTIEKIDKSTVDTNLYCLDVVPFPYEFNESRLTFLKTSHYLLELSHNVVVTNIGMMSGTVLGKISSEDRAHLEKHRKLSFTSTWVLDEHHLTGMDIHPLTLEDQAWASKNNLAFDNTIFAGAATSPLPAPVITALSSPSTTTSAEVVHLVTSTPTLPTLTADQAEVKRVFDTTFKYHTELFPRMTAPDLFKHIQAALTQYLELREPME